MVLSNYFFTILPRLRREKAFWSPAGSWGRVEFCENQCFPPMTSQRGPRQLHNSERTLPNMGAFTRLQMQLVEEKAKQGCLGKRAEMHYLLVWADLEGLCVCCSQQFLPPAKRKRTSMTQFYRQLPAALPTCRLPSSMLLSSSILAATSSCWWLCLSWSIAAACWWFSSERKEAGYREQKEKFVLPMFTLINNISPALSSITAYLIHTVYISWASVLSFYSCYFLKYYLPWNLVV